MSSECSRRGFLTVLSSTLAASMVPVRRLLASGPAALDPAFRGALARAGTDIRFGYSAITWKEDDAQAIEDLSALGFKGIQLRANVLKTFGTQPQALRDLLDKHGLTFVALSSGNVRLDPAVEADDLALHTAHAKFVHDVGGLYLQVTDQRPKGRAVTPDDYKRMGRLITEIGKRSADVGVPLGYHNHLNDLGERPQEVDWILEAADPRYVKLELDTAYYHLGGGSPIKAVEKYADRLLFVHLKDARVTAAPVPPGEVQRGYKFVELGEGEVDNAGVLKALDRVKFRGWVVVELDSVPEKTRTPRQSAEMCKQYLEGKLGLKI
jgi:inosose dehydratase